MQDRAVKHVIKYNEIWGRNFLEDLLTWYYLSVTCGRCCTRALMKNSDLSNYNTQIQVNKWLWYINLIKHKLAYFGECQWHWIFMSAPRDSVSSVLILPSCCSFTDVIISKIWYNTGHDGNNQRVEIYSQFAYQKHCLSFNV